MKRHLLPLVLLALGLASPLRAVNFNGLFTDNFDAMGAAGTAAPSGWSVSAYAGASGDWTAATGITGVSGGTANATLVATTTFASTSSATQGYNFATSTNTTDRSLGTSPTGNKGTALELALTNTTGASLSSIQVRYDTRRFANGGTANTLVGYWLFYSLDGGTTWTNVSALNPAISGSTGVVVPNTTGTTIVPPTTITLSAAWTNGSNLLLRWVDDNASESSPDQIIGLDNVSIATTPTDSIKTGLLLNGSTIVTSSGTAGTGSYVTMGSAAALGASSFTLECKIYKTGAGTTASTGSGGVVAVPLVAKGRSEADGSAVDCNYFMGIDSTTGKLCADFEQLNATNNGTAYLAGQNFPILGSTVLANNTWYHLAATYDSTTAVWKLYVNGVEETTTVPSGSPTTFVGVVPRNDSTQHFAIGSALNSGGVAIGFFQGVIDEVRVWNVARNSTQILASKDAEITSATTGLLGRYGLNEGTGATVSNTVGTNGAPLGTATGSPVWVDGAAFTSNAAPVVALTSPANGTTAALASGVALTATASDSDGTVTQVDFLRDGSVVGTDTTSPYSFTDSTVTAGLHTYAARATDNAGATTTSVTVTVSVLADPTKTSVFFDGVNDYVTMGAAPELNAGGPPSNGFTLECWFRKEGVGLASGSGNGGVTAVPLFGKGRGEAENSNVDCNYFFGITTGGLLVADFEAQAGLTGITAGQNYPITASNTPIANNRWYHAAVTYDGTAATWTMYLDGVQVGTATAATGALPRYDSIQHFGIGAAFNSTGVAEGAFAGRIDEVRVWNYARSSSQIAAAKDTEIASATGLIGRYGLNEGTGTSASNTVGVAGAPVGTLTNGPIWADGAPLTANTPPAVALTSPTDGTTVRSGAVVSLTATASDSDGIAKVEFYAGATKLGEDATSPYTFDWTTGTTGDFTITAKAFDALGTSTSSTAITIHVNPNIAPSVTLTAPADGTTSTAPANMTLTASASDTDGAIAKVEFFNGTTKLAEDSTAPYSYAWTGVASGDYTLTAKATDDLGAITTSGAITLHVMPPTTTPPTISITAPSDNATYAAPATISITASASDSDGTVAKVEFFNGLTKLGEDTTEPFTYNWTNVALGNYTITAKATDDMTATTTSAAITVHVLANQAPVVNATSPANNATGIGYSTSLDLSIADNEGDAQTVNYFGRRTTPATPAADFSIIAIPDTQYYSENTARNPSSGGTGAVAAIFHAQTQWCVDNRTARNIAFVSHMGDIAQNGDAFQSEWQVADASLARLENPITTLRAHGMPWGVAPGNHDQQPIGDAGGATNYYNQYFPFTRWDKRPYYGGHFGTKGGTPANTNNYELFSSGGLDFIIIHMEYDVRALSFYQPVLDWADALLKAYPDRRAIVTSHWIVNTGNPASFSTQGQNIYNALKDNPNFFLMLCGHVHGEGQRSDTFNGHTVHSILSDYQETKNGGNGFLRILTFKPSTNQIHVESYSATLSRAVDASDSIPSWTTAYDLNYNMQGAVTDWIPLGSVNVPTGGTTASLNWTGLEAGKDYEWYATVNDGTNTVTTSTRRFSTTPNAAPVVAITSPADGAGVGLNTTINITATATDSDGSVARVEFFDGGTKIGEDTSEPFTLAWTGASAGNHTLTAVATDNLGLDAISALVTISVNNLPPTVALTEPDPDQIFDAPASVYMTANAADTDGTVAKVEYFVNGTKVGEATTAPYAFFWNNVVTGSYTLIAKATDDGGAFTNSGPLSFSVTNTDNVPPSTSITSPSSGVVFAGTITINASASDTDGTVSKVEFFNGATKLGEDTTAPFSFTWNSVAIGSYTLATKATDNDGAVTTSASVSINVQAAPVSFTETFDSMGTAGAAPPSGWSFYGYTVGTNATWVSSIPATDIAGGTANATLIQTTTFDLANTKSATQGYNFALSTSTSDRALGTSPTTTEGVALQWSVTNTGTTAITAIRLGYDTRRFTAAGTANELPGYWVFYSLDNGTTWTNIAALNPTLAGPTGVVIPNTTGTTTVAPTDVTLSSAWGIGSTLLLRFVDDNAVATSADQIIGLDNVTLSAAAAQIGVPPTTSITAPLASDTFVAPATINISANAADSDGTISKVEFFNGATKLGEATTSPYTFAWTSVAAGTYSLTARATDNDGNVTTSSAVSITVNAAPGSGTLTRGAYLQKASPTTMTIRWRSSQSIAGRVKYGVSVGALNTTTNETSSTTDHEVMLTGLTPNTTYFYSVGSAFDTLAGGDAAHTFTTPPTTGSAPSTRVWVLGDAGTGTASQTTVRDAFYTWTGARDPNLVLELGDNAYNSGTDSEFQAKVFDIYGSLMKRVPFWSCLGNHETGQATSFVDTYPYFSIYSFPKAGECGGVASGTEHYYSFDYGNVHFISLDSMTASRSATGAMATWLTNDLASTTATWIVCIFHHPPYTKGSHNSDTETELIEMRTNILPILEAGGVDLVLCGHSHCYERSYLLDGHYGASGTLTAGMKKDGGDGRPAGTGAYIKPLFGRRDHFGAVYAVAGSSGQISGGSLNHPAHFISLNNLGSLVLDVSGTRLDATFLRENGATNDTFTVIKQGGSLPPSATTLAASNITATSATLNATVSPNGVATTAKFQHGTSNSYGTDTSITLSPNDGNDAQSVSLPLTGLLPNTTYHFRVSATNTNGTTDSTDVTFTTPKLAQAITFAPLTDKTFGDAPFDVSASGGGSTAAVVFSIVSGPATISGSTVTLTGAGDVTVRASQAGDASYLAAADVDHSFTVAKATSAINFAPLSGKSYGAAPFDVSATTSGSTSPVVLSIVSGPATISGSTITLTGAGTVVVRASQAADSNYAAAPDVHQSFDVSKGTQIISFDAVIPGSAQVGSTVPLIATSNYGLVPVTFSVVSGPGTITNNALSLTNVGAVVVQAAQAGDANYLPATAQMTITATTNAPFISAPPESQIAIVGQPVTFSVSVTGAGPFTYQWKKNGTNITNAKASSLTIPLPTAASIGSYTVEVKNSLGTTLSTAAELATVDGAAKTLALAPGGTATLSITTAGAGLSFRWSKDGTPISDSAHAIGSATNKLVVKPLVREDAGVYTCTVSKVGISSRTGGANTVTVSTMKPELAPIEALPAGAIGKPYSYQVQTLPDQPGQTKTAITKFSASGLPAGLTISATGLISGTPTASATTKTISITATNDAGTSLAEPCTLTVLPLPSAAVGAFVARFERAPLNANVGGRLDLSVTTAGAFTAKLTQIGISTTNTVTSKGTLRTTVAEGSTVVVPTGSTTFPRPTGSPLELTFGFSAATNELTGTLTDPDSSDTSAMTGVRNVWSATLNKATSFAGYYTFALDLTASSIGNATIPQGNGFGSFTAAESGALTFAGRTADGLGYTATTIAGPLGQVVVFAPLISSGGSVTGTPTLAADVASSFANNTISGELTWSKTKPTSTTDRTYASGFGPVTLTVAGGKYTPPAAGEVVMQLPNADNNARIAFASGGLSGNQSPPVTFSIRNNDPLGVLQTISLPLAGSTDNPARTTFTFATTPKGQFSGGFTVKTPGTGTVLISRTATYTGMIVRQGSSYDGVGYFLLPQLPIAPQTATTAPIQSGQVTLEPAP